MVQRVLICGFAALLSAGCSTPGPITEVDTGASALEALGPRRTAAGALGGVFGARATTDKADDYLVDPMGNIVTEDGLDGAIETAIERRSLSGGAGASAFGGSRRGEFGLNTEALAPPPPIDSGYAPIPEVLFEGANAPLTSDPQIPSLSGEFTAFDLVNFATDSSSLSYEAQAILERQAAWLVSNPTASAIIEGHCDERGTRDYNLALGQRRAEAVFDYLMDAGVDSSRLRTVSYGKERPLAEALCSAPSCWLKNRRAVTVVQSLL